MGKELRWAIGVLFGAAVLLLLVRSMDARVRRSASLPPLPVPNGYDALLAAARRDVRRPAGDLSGVDAAELRTLHAAQRGTLEAVRAALAIESRVTGSVGRDASRQRDQDLARLKALHAIFAVDFRVQMLDGKTNDAALTQLDFIRLGHTLAKGGDRTDVATGLLFEVVGASTLNALVPQLDSATCTRAAASLARLEHARASADQVDRNDRAWRAIRFGLVGKIGDLLLRRANEARRGEVRRRWDEAALRSRRLALRLAARAFTIETGKPPTRPAELVPAYLPAVPVDPGTGAAWAELPHD
jgi:hypothetical protein